MELGLNNLLNFLKTDLYIEAPLKFGKYHFLVTYKTLIICSVLLVVINYRSFLKMALNPRSIADLRVKALPDNKPRTADATSEIHQEVREMRLKLELLCEEIRSLRREMSASSSQLQIVSAPSKTYQRAYPTISYPLPESRFD